MHRHLTWSVHVLSGLTVLLLSVGVANAAAILVTDSRQINATASVDVGGVPDAEADSSAPPSPFAPWSDVVLASAAVGAESATAVASQQSSVDPTLFDALGRADVALNVTTGIGAAIANSTFTIGFDLATPHNFTLTGALSESHPGFVSLSFGSHSFGAGILAASGVLDPGTYLFHALADPTIQGTLTEQRFGAFDFAFTLTEVPPTQVVPEPSAMILLASGATGLAAFRRWRKASRTR